MQAHIILLAITWLARQLHQMAPRHQDQREGNHWRTRRRTDVHLRHTYNRLLRCTAALAERGARGYNINILNTVIIAFCLHVLNILSSALLFGIPFNLHSSWPSPSLTLWILAIWVFRVLSRWCAFSFLLFSKWSPKKCEIQRRNNLLTWMCASFWQVRDSQLVNRLSQMANGGQCQLMGSVLSWVRCYVQFNNFLRDIKVSFQPGAELQSLNSEQFGNVQSLLTINHLKWIFMRLVPFRADCRLWLSAVCRLRLRWEKRSHFSLPQRYFTWGKCRIPHVRFSLFTLWVRYARCISVVNMPNIEIWMPFSLYWNQ